MSLLTTTIPVGHLEDIRVALTRDGASIVTAGAKVVEKVRGLMREFGRPYGAKYEYFVSLWDATTGDLTRNLGEYVLNHEFQTLIMSGDGIRVVSSTVLNYREVEVFEWDALAGTNKTQRFQGEGFDSTLLAVSPDGTRLVLSDYSKKGGPCVVGWDTKEPTTTLAKPRGYIYSVVFSPDGATVAMGCGREKFGCIESKNNGMVQLLDATTGNCLRTLSLETRHAVFPLEFSADGALLAAGFSSGVAIFDVATGERRITLEATGAKLCLAFSSDRAAFAVGNADGSAQLWDTTTGILLEARESCDDVRFTSVAMGAEGMVVAYSDPSGDIVITRRSMRATADAAALGRPQRAVTTAFDEDVERALTAMSDGPWDAAVLAEGCRVLGTALSKRQSPSYLYGNGVLVAAVLRAMRTFGDNGGVQTAALEALANIAYLPKSDMADVARVMEEVMVRWGTDEGVASVAVHTLLEIVVGHDGEIGVIFGTRSVLEALAAILHTHGGCDGLCEEAVDIIEHVCRESPGSAHAVAASGTADLFVGAMATCYDGKWLERGCRVLFALSRHSVFPAGCVEAALTALERFPDDDELQELVLHILRAAANDDGQCHVPAPLYVRAARVGVALVLAARTNEAQTSALVLLSGLASSSRDAAVFAVESGAAGAAVRAIYHPVADPSRSSIDARFNKLDVRAHACTLLGALAASGRFAQLRAARAIHAIAFAIRSEREYKNESEFVGTAALAKLAAASAPCDFDLEGAGALRAVEGALRGIGGSNDRLEELARSARTIGVDDRKPLPQSAKAAAQAMYDDARSAQPDAFALRTHCAALLEAIAGRFCKPASAADLSPLADAVVVAMEAHVGDAEAQSMCCAALCALATNSEIQRGFGTRACGAVFRAMSVHAVDSGVQAAALAALRELTMPPGQVPVGDGELNALVHAVIGAMRAHASDVNVRFRGWLVLVGLAATMPAWMVCDSAVIETVCGAVLGLGREDLVHGMSAAKRTIALVNAAGVASAGHGGPECVARVMRALPLAADVQLAGVEYLERLFASAPVCGTSLACRWEAALVALRAHSQDAALRKAAVSALRTLALLCADEALNTDGRARVCAKVVATMWRGFSDGDFLQAAYELVLHLAKNTAACARALVDAGAVELIAATLHMDGPPSVKEQARVLGVLLGAPTGPSVEGNARNTLWDWACTAPPDHRTDILAHLVGNLPDAARDFEARPDEADLCIALIKSGRVGISSLRRRAKCDSLGGDPAHIEFLWFVRKVLLTAPVAATQRERKAYAAWLQRRCEQRGDLEAVGRQFPKDERDQQAPFVCAEWSAGLAASAFA
eukprot:Opistho-1_new@6103